MFFCSNSYCFLLDASHVLPSFCPQKRLYLWWSKDHAAGNRTLGSRQLVPVPGEQSSGWNDEKRTTKKTALKYVNPKFCGEIPRCQLDSAMKCQSLLKKIHERSAFKDIALNQKQPRTLSTAAAFFVCEIQVDFVVHVKASGPSTMMWQHKVAS